MVSLDDLEKYCKGKGFKLSDLADRVYRLIRENRGSCLCRVEDIMCPCPMHIKEIEEFGHCKCNLFVRGENV